MAPLDAMEVINQGMLFAATLLLCLFPFLIVASALAGRPLVNTLARYTGLNSQAAADVDHLFASSAATASAVVGTAEATPDADESTPVIAVQHLHALGAQAPALSHELPLARYCGHRIGHGTIVGSVRSRARCVPDGAANRR